MNVAVLLASDDQADSTVSSQSRPYVELEPDPAPPNPTWLESLRTDWEGFIVPFVHEVFTEPNSEDLIAEVVAIALGATPDVIATQELEFD